jgi:hypothetical protein
MIAWHRRRTDTAALQIEPSLMQENECSAPQSSPAARISVLVRRSAMGYKIWPGANAQSVAGEGALVPVQTLDEAVHYIQTFVQPGAAKMLILEID